MPAYPVPIQTPAAVEDFLLDEEFDTSDIVPSENSIPDMDKLALVCDNVAWAKGSDSDNDEEGIS